MHSNTGTAAEETADVPQEAVEVDPMSHKDETISLESKHSSVQQDKEAMTEEVNGKGGEIGTNEIRYSDENSKNGLQEALTDEVTLQSYDEVSVLSREDDTVDKSQCLFDLISYDEYSEETIKDDDGDVDIEEITVDSDDEFVVEEEITADDIRDDIEGNVDETTLAPEVDGTCPQSMVGKSNEGSKSCTFPVATSTSSPRKGRDEDLDNLYAARVQAVVRGFLVRSDSKRRESEVDWLASVFSCKILGVEADTDDVNSDVNVTKIQAAARGFLTRKASKRRESADVYEKASSSSNDLKRESSEAIEAKKGGPVKQEQNTPGGTSIGSLTTDSPSEYSSNCGSSMHSATKFPPVEILLPSTFTSPSETNASTENQIVANQPMGMKRVTNPRRNASFQQQERPPTSLQVTTKASIIAMRQVKARRDLERRECTKIQALVRGFLSRRHQGALSPCENASCKEDSAPKSDDAIQFGPNHPRDVASTTKSPASATSTPDSLSKSVQDRIKDLQRQNSESPKLWKIEPSDDCPRTSKQTSDQKPGAGIGVEDCKEQSEEPRSPKNVLPQLDRNDKSINGDHLPTTNEKDGFDQQPNPAKNQATPSADSASTPVKERTDSVETFTSARIETSKISRPPLSPTIAGNRSRNNTWNSNHTPRTPNRGKRPPVLRSPGASPPSGKHSLTSHDTVEGTSRRTNACPPSPTSPRTELEGSKLNISRSSLVNCAPKRHDSQRSNTTSTTAATSNTNKEGSSSDCDSSLSKSNHKRSKNDSVEQFEDDPFDDDMTVKSVKKAVVEMNEASPYYRESIAPLYQSWHSFEFSKKGKMRPVPRKKSIPVRRYSCPTAKNAIQVTVKKEETAKMKSKAQNKVTAGHGRGGHKQAAPSKKPIDSSHSSIDKKTPRSRPLINNNNPRTNPNKTRWKSFSSGVPVALPKSPLSSDEEKPLSIQERIRLFQRQ